MKDIVRMLEGIALDSSLIYHYGRKAALNLLDGSADADTTYLLHEFTNRKSEYNDSGTQIVAANYEGKFFLVKQSDLDQNYFAETGTQETSKYTLHIEPLLEVFKTIGNRLSCLGIEVNQWDNIDVTDALDANMDGLLCTYKLRIPANYE